MMVVYGDAGLKIERLGNGKFGLWYQVDIVNEGKRC